MARGAGGTISLNERHYLKATRELIVSTLTAFGRSMRDILLMARGERLRLTSRAVPRVASGD